MLQPRTLELHEVQGRRVIVARYDHAATADSEEFIRHLAFYTADDLGDMLHLFYPGDRQAHETVELALAEIDTYGFE